MSLFITSSVWAGDEPKEPPANAIVTEHKQWETKDIVEVCVDMNNGKGCQPVPKESGFYGVVTSRDTN